MHTFQLMISKTMNCMNNTNAVIFCERSWINNDNIGNKFKF